MPSRLRLLYVSHSIAPLDRPPSNIGSMQRAATELHEALRNHPSVSLSSLILRTSWRSTQLRTPPFLLRTLLRLPLIVRRDDIAVVLFSSMVTASLTPFLRMRRLNGVAFAAIAHGRDVTLPVYPYQWHLRWTLPKLEAVVAVSEATREQCVRRGARKDRVTVIPNGVAPERFQVASTRESARRQLSAMLSEYGGAIPRGSVLLASVGRHVPRKGFAWFIREVMTQLPGRFVYLLAGHGPETTAIKKEVATLRLESRVRVLDIVQEETLKALYRGSDLFVMPNIPVRGDMEGFGVVMLEAGMSGLPVVAAHLEGISSVIREGENGVLVPSGNARAFVDAISTCAKDRGALERFSKRAERYTREHFAWPVVIEQYVDKLRAL